MFWLGVPLGGHPTSFCYAPPDMGVSGLQLVAFEYVRRNVLRIKKLGSTDSHWILSYRGKDPRKPKRFSWSVQGSLRGNRNPLRLFFFCQRFLLEKQKKMLMRSRKFAAGYQPFNRLLFSSTRAEVFRFNPLSQPLADSSPCRKGSCFFFPL